MTPAFTAVLLYAAWAMLLALFYAFPRVPKALMGKLSIDSWERNKTNPDPEFMQRAKGAHLNCLENFPLFAAVVCIAALLNKSEVVNALGMFVLYARVAQSVCHILGTSFVLIMARATFFLAQVAMTFWMIWSLLR